jgi:hypothetical protein
LWGLRFFAPLLCYFSELLGDSEYHNDQLKEHAHPDYPKQENQWGNDQER